jgi:hypothetical protein
MIILDHYSIDLETLGTRYNAAVISIGVQQFDPNTGKLGATFYKEIDFDSAIKAGRPTGDTIRWWMTQTEKARRIFARNPAKVSVATALDELATWMRGMAGAPKVWGNGATFDITILEHAYDNGCVGLKEPWHFTNIRDMRTIEDAADLAPVDYPERKGVHHNALDDAIYQAQVISIAWQRCRGPKAKPLGGKPAKAEPKPAPATTVDDEEL